MGLLQDKGVHAHQEHLFAILKLLKDKGIEKDKVIIHIFGDGRDSPPASLKDYVNLLLKKMDYLDIGVIGSVIGRYYSMDRDTRWDRTQKAYDLLAKGVGSKHDDVMSAIDSAYDAGETDEFIKPRVVGDFTGIFGGDVVMCYNYRTDRVRQLCRALLEDDFSEFERSPLGVRMVVLTNYYKDVPASIVFDDVKVDNLLGEVISKAGLKQLRISETEKYPHVTFFFNGQIEEPYKGEERVLIPSPRDVPTYDKKPQMSVFEIKSALIEEMDKDYSLIVVNFVNGDMVGHTGKMAAAVKAVEAVDKCLEKTIKAGLEKRYINSRSWSSGRKKGMGRNFVMEDLSSHGETPKPWST